MGNNLPLTTGSILKQLRESHELTQEEIAEKIGCTVKTYRSWEKNNDLPRTDYLLVIADLFGVDVDYLLGRIDEQTHDLEFVCKYTGLSAETITRIRELRPGGALSTAFAFRGEFDSFISRYGTDFAFRLGQLHHAIDEAMRTTTDLKSNSVTADNWEQLFGFVEDRKRNLVLELFEYTEFFKRAQEELFPANPILDELSRIQRSIHKPKKVHRIQRSKEASDNG